MPQPHSPREPGRALAPVRIGDVILIATSGHSSGRPDRCGEVVGLLHAGERTHYHVRWPDGSESVLDGGDDKSRGAPMNESPTPPPQIGDIVAVHGHHVGEPERLGEILEVLGEPGHVHFRVRWDEEHESVFYPGSDAIVRPPKRKRASRS